MIAPVWEFVLLNGHGPRVAKSGLGRLQAHACSARYEDLKTEDEVSSGEHLASTRLARPCPRREAPSDGKSWRKCPKGKQKG